MLGANPLLDHHGPGAGTHSSVGSPGPSPARARRPPDAMDRRPNIGVAVHPEGWTTPETGARPLSQGPAIVAPLCEHRAHGSGTVWALPCRRPHVQIRQRPSPHGPRAPHRSSGGLQPWPMGLAADRNDGQSGARQHDPGSFLGRPTGGLSPGSAGPLGRSCEDVPDHIADAASEAYVCPNAHAHRAAAAPARARVEATARDKGTGALTTRSRRWRQIGTSAPR